MEPELKKAIGVCRDNFPVYSKNILRIVTKDAQMIPFRLNEAQRLVHARLEAQLAETGMVRALILKCRQSGISTYVQGRFYWKVTKNKNTNAFVLSHLEESTTAIFEMAARFYDNTPHIAFQPSLKQRTTRGLHFAPPVNSKYRVGTARSGNTGVSQTNQLVHGSEVALYPDAQQITTGLLQTVGNVPGTEIILESTARGAGGWFYDRCIEALQGKGEYQLIFIPWFMDSGYRKKIYEPLEKDEEEQYLSHKHGLDDEQLAWRRAKIMEVGDDLFKQEYPANPEEAFLSSGRSFVEPRHLDVAEMNCWTPVQLAEITPLGILQQGDGRLSIWVEPRASETYVIGVDVSEGLERGDYSCIQVLDSTGNQVACWHGHIDPMELGDLVRLLAIHYRKAWVLVERNNHGLTTLRRMQQLGYPNLYVEKEVDNAYSDRLTKRAGWLTTTKTKPLIIDNLASLLRSERSGIADRNLVKELRTYVVDGKGKTNAQAGCYDDRVMAYAIALFGLNSMPRKSANLHVHTRPYEPVDSAVGF